MAQVGVLWVRLSLGNEVSYPLLKSQERSFTVISNKGENITVKAIFSPTSDGLSHRYDSLSFDGLRLTPLLVQNNGWCVDIYFSVKEQLGKQCVIQDGTADIVYQVSVEQGYMKFYNWKAFFKGQAVIVSVRENQINSFREKPKDTSMPLQVNVKNCFEAVRSDGDWVLLESRSEHCFFDGLENGQFTGWVRFRIEDKLLLEFKEVSFK